MNKLIKEYRKKTMVEKAKKQVMETKHDIHTFLTNLWEFLVASSMLVVAGYAIYSVQSRIHTLDALMIVGVAAIVTSLSGLGAFYRFLKNKE